MKRSIFVATSVLAMALALLAAQAPIGPVQASPPGTTTYSFNLDPPNTAEAANGDVIRPTGGGMFDVTNETVNAGGSFTHFDPAGGVLARGTWRATGFVDFSTIGGPSPGFQTGILDIEVTLFPVGGPPVTGVPMTVVCNLAPLGFDIGQQEGTTLGDFTDIVGGLTLFNLHQGL